MHVCMYVPPNSRSSAITEGPHDALCYVNAMFHEVWELERFQSAKVTFKVIQRHWQ